MTRNFDYVIVGAGLAGMVIAERLVTLHRKSCLIVEKRNHIGGNCHDEYDESGVLVHTYGPHYFRTNSPRIKQYLSAFTEWHNVQYTIQSYSDGRLWSFPINLLTYEQLIGRESTEAEFAAYLATNRVKIDAPKNSEEIIISQVGWQLYEKFFKNYTLKQWRRHPRDLDASVCGRIPVRTIRDGRYFNDSFQALPRQGYHQLFRSMLNACGNNVEVLLKTNFRDIRRTIRYKHLIYTGPIDEYFDYCYGPLPYRSLRFERQSFTADELTALRGPWGKQGFYQPAVQVNYPNDELYTRIVEVKHVTGQKCDNTTIVREYPVDFRPGSEPYYPIPAPDALRQFALYNALAAQEINVSFVGRLATYRYYNMDQVVGMALSEADKLRTTV